MGDSSVNRRRFLGYSAAAGLALSSGAAPGGAPVRLGFVGVGNRGTALLRALLDLSSIEVAAVCDLDARHTLRAQGIVEKSQGHRPEACNRLELLLARPDVDGAIVALPCDLHAQVYEQVLLAGKHLYAEKPLGLTVEECDRVIECAGDHPELVVQMGFQRRFNARFVQLVDRLRRGDIGNLIECRCSWNSSQGPMSGKDGWMSRRARSGDWMLEQAVHVWDLLCRIEGSPPATAYGRGRRDLFHSRDPHRDVTDWYVAELAWPSGFHATVRHSWVDVAAEHSPGMTMRFLGSEGGIDLATGTVSYREKSRARELLLDDQVSDTRRAIENFVAAVQRKRSNASDGLAELTDAKLATLVGLMVRRAVDENRLVHWIEPTG
jgi:predicted dehydrogenase